MKKNGFTLVELLGVITVLAIVMGIVSVAYIGITRQIDLAYYRSLEESLLLSGGEYFSYSKDNQPKLLGEETKIDVKYLVENQYIEPVNDRKGNSCEEKSYVSAYKDSALKTNYYVCLVCNNYKTETDACLGVANYELQVEAKTKETKKIYYPNAGVFSSENIILTFKTLADIKTIYLENEDKSIVKSCILKDENGIKTCSIEVTESDKYKYYGESSDKTQKTREKDLEILIDLTPPEFLIEQEGPIEIDIETLSGEISNRVYEIKDLESGIKNIRYSFEKENEEKFQDTIIKEEFSVRKNLDRGNYKLIVEVTNNALLKTTKEVNYIVYEKVDIPSASEVCLNNLTYNGKSQTITKPISDSSSYTYLNNKKTAAGDHIVQVQLKDNYYWNDGTNANKEITCNIKRKEATIKANDQTIVFGNSISKTVNDVTATGLVSSHTITSISLSQSITTVTNNGEITPSGAVVKSGTTDVTNNYDIKYQKGTLVINPSPLSGGKVVIKGEATYGETLTATLTETEPSASYSYAWYVSDTNTTTGGTKVSSSNSLVLNASTFDKYVYLVVTATKDNYVTKTITDITDASNNNTAKVAARPIVVTARTSSRVYNGLALTNNNCTATNLAFSHEVSCTMTSNSTITNVGTVNNTINQVTILSNDGSSNVTSYYSVSKVAGKLTVTRKSLTIKAKDQTITYPNSINTGSSYITIETLVSGHEVTSITLKQSTTAVTSNGEITPSEAVIKSGTTDVTNNYDINYQKGTLVINSGVLSGGTVVIKGEATYGETLTATLTNTNPSASYSYAWYVSDTNTTTGGTKVSSSNSLVLNATTFDKYVYLVVTATKDNYVTKTITDITDASNNNTAKVAARPIVVTARSSSRVYNGSALTNNTCTTTNLAFDHTASCTMTSNSTITNVGSVNNTINQVSVLSNDGASSVTKYYTITKNPGKLTVTEATLSGGKVVINGEATYGEKLTATLTGTTPGASYSYAWYTNDTNSTSGGELLETGETLNLNGYTFDKYVYLVVTATKDNYKTKTITDITDATNNTTAKVAARKLVVTAGSSSRVYNGSALTNSTCTADNLAYTTHTVSCTMTSGSTITNVGNVNNTISEVKLLGSNGTTSVNKYYDITTKTGKLTVTEATLSGGKVVINGEATYGGKLTATLTGTTPGASYSYAWYTNDTNSTSGGELLETGETLNLNGYTFDKYVYLVVTATKANYKTKTITDITDATNNTTAKVAARKLVVTAGSNSRVYNGSALTNSTCTADNLAYTTHTVSCTMTSGSTITNVGSVNNTISEVKLLGSNGTTSVNKYYDITTKTGKLTISSSPTASIGSCSNKTYNGTEQTIATNGTNTTISGHKQIEVGDYIITYTSKDNYTFSDGTTKKTLTCSIEGGKPTVTISISGDSDTCSNAYIKGAKATVTCTSSLPITTFSGKVGSTSGTASGDDYTKTATINLSSTGSKTIKASCENSLGTTTLDKSVTIKVYTSSSSCDCKTRYTASTAGTTCSRCSSWAVYSNVTYTNHTSKPSDYCYVSSSNFMKYDYQEIKESQYPNGTTYWEGTAVIRKCSTFACQTYKTCCHT